MSEDSRKIKGKPASHRDLIVWQKAMDLAVDVYGLAGRFPRQEMYRLVDQITRSVASIPANIAEGRSRASRKEFANFLAIAKGSLMETETFLTLAVRLHYVASPDAEPAFSLITEISKMLTALRNRLLQTTTHRPEARDRKVVANEKGRRPVAVDPHFNARFATKTLANENGRAPVHVTCGL